MEDRTHQGCIDGQFREVITTHDYRHQYNLYLYTPTTVLKEATACGYHKLGSSFLRKFCFSIGPRRRIESFNIVRFFAA